jgi:hypothetical protein
MNEEIKDKIITLSKGNSGALTFLLELYKYNVFVFIEILQRIESIPSLVGTNLYVLWSDLCEQNMEQVIKLCANCPNDILADACSRQDYSGRELVKEYL